MTQCGQVEGIVAGLNLFRFIIYYFGKELCRCFIAKFSYAVTSLSSGAVYTTFVYKRTFCTSSVSSGRAVARTT